MPAARSARAGSRRERSSARCTAGGSGWATADARRCGGRACTGSRRRSGARRSGCSSSRGRGPSSLGNLPHVGSTLESTTIPWSLSLFRSAGVNRLMSRATTVSFMRSHLFLRAPTTRSAVAESGHRIKTWLVRADMPDPAGPVLHLAEDVRGHLVAGPALEATGDLLGLHPAGDGLDDRFPGELQHEGSRAAAFSGPLAERGELGRGGRVEADDHDAEVGLDHHPGLAGQDAGHLLRVHGAAEIGVEPGLARDAEAARVIDRGLDAAQGDQPGSKEGIQEHAWRPPPAVPRAAGARRCSGRPRPCPSRGRGRAGWFR